MRPCTVYVHTGCAVCVCMRVSVRMCVCVHVCEYLWHVCACMSLGGAHVCVRVQAVCGVCMHTCLYAWCMHAYVCPRVSNA